MGGRTRRFREGNISSFSLFLLVFLSEREEEDQDEEEEEEFLS
jgi:hypothetical protein